MGKSSKSRRKKLDTFGGMLDALQLESADDVESHLEDYVMIFVPGDRGQGYRRITRVRVHEIEFRGATYRRIILYANNRPRE